MTSLLEVAGLKVAFNGTTVVDGVSFTLERGECLALVGESGSGKSVTTRTLVGLPGYGARVHTDRLRFDGTDVTGFTDRTWRRVRGARIGFVLQDAMASLDPLRPVGREIAEPLALHTTLNRAARAARVHELLESVGVPEPEVRAAQYPHQLSGGLRQRALIASAIACEPELLLADEPTTALDATVALQVLDLLGSLKGNRSGLLIVSHDLAVVARLADRVAVMKAGRIVELGATDAVLRDPQHPYTKALLAAVPSAHAKGTWLSTVERPAAAAPVSPPAAAQPGRPVLAAVGLRKSFPGPDGVARVAVEDVSLTLRAGETLGIVGESGSGKSTTARLLLGLETPDAGEVHVDGTPWPALTPEQRRAHRRRLQIVYQDPLGSFDPRFTVERVIGEALGAAGHPRGARRERTVELLEMVALDAGHLRRRPLELSGGQRQRVAVARALAAEPEVIVCDEPVSALDVSVQAQILDLLADLQARLGVAYLFISHDLGVVYHASDRVLVMRDGRVLESGDVRTVFTDPQHDYTRELLAAIPRLTPQVAPPATPLGVG
ncbi:dipeptide ABC transporter ATP-binding protein [Planotetraspora kaengkrachanensis]|uniref:ABC transporter ATP-binding protein n=1 Tax=Planotetraspora kaengkrachanensis TaxID=575193 RepID=A0A8J3LTX3_9ACTN|nr:ABC transporter ATP-binding protein [Planotetraspora kaengkrachanensis]GIG77714.1 ABC transporter ATP-binding protein [Planotetraspora kaengkrachanensis]